MKNMYLRVPQLPIQKFMLLLVIVWMQLWSVQTHATVYNVTTTTDGNATNQLRGALLAANATAGPHTINLPAGFYTLGPGGLYIGNVNNQDVTIVGAGLSVTTINASNTNRILYIDSAGNHTGVHFKVSGVTFLNGKADADSYGGAAILGYGPGFVINIDSCFFQNNMTTSSGGSGAALSLGAGTVSITNTTFNINSTATGVGGAISYFLGNNNIGNLTINHCLFSGNTANGPNALGGALYVSVQGNSTNPSNTFNASIQENSFTGNHTTGTNGKGGAIYISNLSAFGQATVKYNRFSGNTAAVTGASALYLSNTGTIFGAVDLSQNWYGCNGGPTVCDDRGSVALPASGSYSLTPYLQLKTTVSPTNICNGGTATVVTGFTSNSANATIANSNLGAFLGVPITYSSNLGSVTGTTSTAIQADGTATGTFTATGSGTSNINPIIDDVPATDLTARANLTINTSTVPVIVTPLTGNSGICFGATVTFHINETGTTSYQWYKGATALVDGATGTGSTIAGSTTSTMTIINSGAGDISTAYQVKLTNGCGTVSTSFVPLVFSISPTPTNAPQTQTQCSGGAATFTIGASGTGPFTYQWRKGTTNLTNGTTANGSVITGATNDTMTISNLAVADAGTYNVVITNNCISAFSASGTLTVNSPGSIWLGTSSANWSDAANWNCNTLPTATTDVTIPAGTTFSPVINVTTAAVNNLTINSGATLAFTGTTNALDVKGNISGTGTFNGSLGKTTFSGTTQNIPAATYKNLQISGGGSKTLSGDANVTGTLTLTSGFLVLGANDLTIASTGNITGNSATSFIVDNGTGNLIQQNIGTGGRTGAIVFPVGVSTSSYTPASLTNIGTADNFTIGVISNLYTSYNSSDVPTGTAVSSNAVAKTWLVSEGTAGGSNVTLGLTWNAADELTSFTRNSCVVSHYTSGAWHQTTTTSAATGSNPYTQTLSNITSFSPFGVGSIGSPLPLELISFTGNVSNHVKTLNWKTTDEKNTDHFALERSDDAKTFTSIASVKATGNQKTGTNTYSYIDKSGNSNVYYYRLNMVDLDGTSTYSNTIQLIMDDTHVYSFSVSPNPFKDQVSFTVQAPKASTAVLMLTDISGRTLITKTTNLENGANTLELDQLKNLPEGIYFLRFNNEETSKTFKIVKIKG